MQLLQAFSPQPIQKSTYWSGTSNFTLHLQINFTPHIFLVYNSLMVVWQEIENKLQLARESRQAGLEGKARVIARLAVADAIRELYTAENEPIPAGSAYDLLAAVTSAWLLPSKFEAMIEHFTQKVDANYHLPVEVDLIKDAESIIEWVQNKINGEGKPMSENPSKIKIYATSWCGGSRRARTIFNDNKIEYEWIDIDENPEAAKFVESVNRGYRSVPTIVFPDGTILTEPSSAELMAKLGLKLAF